MTDRLELFRLPLLGAEVRVRIIRGGNRGYFDADGLWLAARPDADRNRPRFINRWVAEVGDAALIRSTDPGSAG